MEKVFKNQSVNLLAKIAADDNDSNQLSSTLASSQKNVKFSLKFSYLGLKFTNLHYPTFGNFRTNIKISSALGDIHPVENAFSFDFG
jgi:hypothetical protein